VIYTLADCLHCLQRYAVAPVRAGLFGLVRLRQAQATWPVVYVQALVAADGPLCVTCGTNLETAVLLAVQTANGSWISLGSLTLEVAAFAN